MNEADLVKMTPPPEIMEGIYKTIPRDWVYKDMPKMSEEFYWRLLKAIGEGECKLLSQAKYPIDGGFLMRSQMMVSPQGIKNLIEYRAQMEKEE